MDRLAVVALPGRVAGVTVFWSVDTNGRIFRSHGGALESARAHVIVDGDGVEWTVREMETPQEWARGERCLVLNSRDCVRRLWNYPSDWRRLDADTLLALDVTRYERVVETPTTREP